MMVQAQAKPKFKRPRGYFINPNLPLYHIQEAFTFEGWVIQFLWVEIDIVKWHEFRIRVI